MPNPQQFKTATEMPYANSDEIKDKANALFKKLNTYLSSVNVDDSISFSKGETIYIPDIHGDFVHLIITLYRHGLVDKELNLNNDFQYVFLGDFYDRAPDSDVMDFWLNSQIKRDLNIFRLAGNHEMAFFERDPNGYPVIFPSQDSIKDISNNFQITEDLLKNIADGTILACYVNRVPTTMLYVHSYVINDDYEALGLSKNTDISIFAFSLNERFKMHGQYAYDLFCECKKSGKFDWKAIMQSFNNDLVFNIYKKKNEINTSFMWRRTSIPTLKVFDAELDVEIPENVYQIVGHTPVFSFNLPSGQAINKPIIIGSKKSTGKIQFSDVGIGYYYKENEFERPEVYLNTKFAVHS